ncbi:exodeoxyribonuclease VIII-like protein [Dickeya undicola]|uniref:Exodeoxyribonuclease VIII-like protein n=1 Tax=Dickeya undicola TaxID=1577887 RepID=A0A3N0G5H9_9GAMM|nr:exodeoxyribonuclease VIII-like protein [Dickeya undicola]RNM07737.1 exodeoxyribonuclease VIII-like protein [Dickeya undicola]
MAMYVASHEPKKSALKNGAKAMATLVEAKNQKLAAMKATMLLEELHPGASDNFFNPTITEDRVGSPRPGIGFFSTDFMDENELVDGVWTRKSDPTPTRPAELSLQEKIAALVLLGKTDLDDHDYSLVLDFFADDESGDDDTHTIVRVLSQYPAVAAMYPARVTELVAEIEKKFSPPIDAAQASAFVNDRIYGKAVDKREPAVIPQSTSPLSSARVWSDFGRLDIAIATSLVTSADSIDAVPAADVARAKELIKEDSDQLFKRLSMELRTQSNALFIPASLIFSIVRAAKKRPEIISDANALHQFVDAALAGWRVGLEPAEIEETQLAPPAPQEPQPEIQNLGGGRFSIDGLISQESGASNQGEKTEVAHSEPAAGVAQQARQALDEMGYGIYAGSDGVEPGVHRIKEVEPGKASVTPDEFQSRAAAIEKDIAEKSEAAQENLSIWKRVHRTDPARTKRKETWRGKGKDRELIRSVTSVNPTYQIMRATEIFGPFGIGWGVEIIEERFDPGLPLMEPVFDESNREINRRPMRDGDGSLIRALNHTIRINLWYTFNGNSGSFPAFGHTKYLYATNSGMTCDDEVGKKSLTDAITKGLSALGFSADVYTGLFDDSEYITENKIEFDIKAASDKAEDTVRLRSELDAKLSRVAETIKSAVSENETTKVYGIIAREVEVHRKNAEANGDSDHAKYLSGRLRRLNDLKDARIAALKTNEGEKA